MNRIIKVDRCESCPCREYDAEWGVLKCTIGGEPEDRGREGVPNDCPLRTEGICIEIVKEE